MDCGTARRPFDKLRDLCSYGFLVSEPVKDPRSLEVPCPEVRIIEV